MWQIISNPERAHKIAERFHPALYQEWKTIKDFPTGIVLDTAANMEKNLVWMVNDPTLYYRVSEDDDYFYIFYMVFHPFDWSDFPIAFIRNWDSHTFDTEGMCFRYSKLHGTLNLGTVYHHSVKFREDSTEKVWIEAEGHGIRPFKREYVEKAKTYVIYNKMKLSNLESFPTSQWDRFRDTVNEAGVNAPDQQAKKGGLYLRPHEVFKHQFGE